MSRPWCNLLHLCFSFSYSVEKPQSFWREAPSALAPPTRRLYTSSTATPPTGQKWWSRTGWATWDRCWWLSRETRWSSTWRTQHPDLTASTHMDWTTARAMRVRDYWLDARISAWPDFTDVWLCVSVSLGALYPDGTGPELKRDDSVAPGTTVTYEWTLPESHSPTSQDSNCLTKFYHSHINTPKDINSGLIGPLIVCKRGTSAFFIVFCGGPTSTFTREMYVIRILKVFFFYWHLVH